jgi:carbonic anhydrase/acetyltransferase-like protein (isoleucine patch superfamily)
MSAPLPDLAAGAASDVAIAGSAVVLGALRMGRHSGLAQGAVVRSFDDGVTIGNGTFVLENSVVVGSALAPVRVGRKTVFGHRCLVVGATVGDLCEIGNASILAPGARLGDRVFLGEGTLIPPGAVIPNDAVVVGRPGRVIRDASDADLERLAALRGGDLSLPDPTFAAITGRSEAGETMGKLYPFRDTMPTVASSAMLFTSAEITGDVVIGDDTIIGAGVKIIGDSHGPVRIGARVQILENTVLHLLPDNELVLDDDVVIGPGAMIHGCRIGAGSIVEPGAIVCDGSTLGARCIVRAGAVVKQRASFGDDAIVDGFPAVQVGTASGPPQRPTWALRRDDIESLRAD